MPKTVNEIVERWFRDHFCGLGPRLDQDLWNEFHAAKEELKARLTESPSTKAVPAEEPLSK